jgi:putative transposase
VGWNPLGSAGKNKGTEFVRLLRLHEEFCEVRIVTYCIMSNHFHVLVEVPQRPQEMPDDAALLAKLRRLYSPEAFARVRWQLENLRQFGAQEEAEALRESFFRRMWDVSFFMKGLKQRFSGWHNRRQGRKGALWEERFKSVLVESGQALVTMATYIDLNPVRAGLVEDPKEYRWCGYAAAVAGKRFVNGIFEAERHLLGTKRRTGARPLRRETGGGLTSRTSERFGGS